MCSYRLISPVQVDEFLADWTKYCRSHQMILGSAPSDSTHAITVHSSGRSVCIHVENPDGATPGETLTLYLKDYILRHPHVVITCVEDEKTLISEADGEDSVGLVTD